MRQFRDATREHVLIVADILKLIHFALNPFSQVAFTTRLTGR